MQAKKQDILNHDWQIFKAKYMLNGGDFNALEDEFMALCEAECLEALSVYSATVNSRFSAKIHKMIESYPDNKVTETMEKRMRGEATKEDYQKALIKHNFNNRHLVSNMTPDDWMVQIIVRQGKVVGHQSNESLAKILKEEPVKEDNDIVYLSFLASILSSGQGLTKTSYMVLLAIANQPYSDLVQDKLYESGSGE